MSGRDPQGCGYVFDPGDREAKAGSTSALSEDVLDDDGVWRCPHESHDGYDRCVFHLPPDRTSDVDVEDRFLTRIAEPGRAPKQFIGANFGSLDLAHVVVESVDNHPVDLRYADFTDTATWEYAIVRQPLNLEAATFHGTADFTETRFRNEVYFSGATFEADARFYEARFAQGGWFYEVTFAEANFHRSTFGGNVDFIQAHFEECTFREAVFTERVHFDEGRFEHASFPGVRFEDDAYFDGAAFPERANFRHASFGATGSFTELKPLDGTCCVDLRDATIASGALVPPTNGEVVYDLRNGEIGDLDVTEDAIPPDLFSHFHFVNTTFDGFDFRTYRDALNAADWTLHEVTSVPGLDTEADVSSAGELESTYLKAKNGANAIGDTKAAAAFFRKEMAYRRYQHATALGSAENRLQHRFVAAWRWVASGLLALTSGYGERPSRVIASSIAIVLAFTGVFSVAKPVHPYGSPVGHLLLSLESFVTLVLGGAEPIRNPWIRLVAQLEGFVGAFLIALFVFTLTRSIHR